MSYLAQAKEMFDLAENVSVAALSKSLEIISKKASFADRAEMLGLIASRMVVAAEDISLFHCASEELRKAEEITCRK